jgi:hypothetical protein
MAKQYNVIARKKFIACQEDPKKKEKLSLFL